MNKTNAPFSVLIPAALGVAIFGWSALFVWQGLDFTDMGFLLTSYEQFYSAPEFNTYFIMNWLTIFIGSWVGELFGGTVVAHKLGASFIFSITGIVAYLGLSIELGRRWVIAFFVFVTFLFITKTYGNWVDYNNLTALFYTCGGVLLFFGLAREHRVFVALSGVVLGANLFVRLPNLLGVGLVTAIILQGLVKRWSIRKTISWSGCFLIGWFLGIGVVVILIFSHGHDGYYLHSLTDFFGVKLAVGSTHSSSNLIKLFVRDHIYLLILSFLVIVAGIIILRCLAYRCKAFQAIAILASATILAIVFKSLESWKWIVPGLLYTGLLWIVWQEFKIRSSLVVLAFISLAVLIIAPLGSDNGIRNSIYGMWLALPLVMTWLWQKNSLSKLVLSIVHTPKAGKLTAIILVIALSGFSLYSTWFYTYRDSSNRLDLIHPIAHPLLKGTYTTKDRARVVSELLAELTRWIKPGDIILAYPDLPTVHFLTETKAWLQNSWPILSRGSALTARLENAMVDPEKLPVVVRSIGSTVTFTWPIDSPRNERPDREAAWKSFDRFVENHPYKLVWKNEFFEILVPTFMLDYEP